MAVAKSFQSFEFLTEPFEVSGRQYIKVRNPKTGTIRTVRWYAVDPTVDKATDPYYKTQKETLGFTKGYITIFKGDIDAENNWFSASNARYTRWWGWYIISTEEIPADLPNGITPVRLPWEFVGDDSGKLFSEERVQKAVEALIYEESDSNFVGHIGNRIELEITITKVIDYDNGFGYSFKHFMKDCDGNEYIWDTTSKRWAEKSAKKIRGTVKAHETFKNKKYTILTRCVER